MSEVEMEERIESRDLTESLSQKDLGKYMETDSK